MASWGDNALLHDGVAFEAELRGRLSSWGWDVSAFGSGLLDDPVRTALKVFRDDYGRPSGLRWLPDLVASRDGRVVLVDAKAERVNTDNYAIPQRALEVGRVLVDRLHTPLFYVWPDGGVLTPDTVTVSWHTRHSGAGTAGSGNPFVLVDKRWAAKAHQVFGR